MRISERRTIDPCETETERLGKSADLMNLSRRVVRRFLDLSPDQTVKKMEVVKIRPRGDKRSHWAWKVTLCVLHYHSVKYLVVGVVSNFPPKIHRTRRAGLRVEFPPSAAEVFWNWASRHTPYIERTTEIRLQAHY